MNSVATRNSGAAASYRCPLQACSMWTYWHVLERLHSVQSLWHPCCCPTFQACLEDCCLLHFAQHIWRAAVGLGLGLASDVSLSDCPCITSDHPFLPMQGVYSCWKDFSEASPYHLQVHQPLQFSFQAMNATLVETRHRYSFPSAQGNCQPAPCPCYRLVFFWLSCGSCLKPYWSVHFHTVFKYMFQILNFYK